MAENQPAALVITHADGYASRVAHAIVTSSGAPPGPGVGWHTACAKSASSVDKWAGGPQTGPDGYDFRAPEQEQPCTRCFPQQKARPMHGDVDGD